MTGADGNDGADKAAGGETGGPRVLAVPDGDSRERLICPDCGFINYENPRIVVGSVIGHDGRILLCRRDIHPRRGFWTIPAGYLELNETVADGARREAREEVCAEIVLDRVLGIYNVPRISQVQIIYRAGLATSRYGIGEETQEVALFLWDDIPWDEIAFPSVRWALEHYRAVEGIDAFAPHCNPDGDVGNY